MLASTLVLALIACMGVLQWITKRKLMERIQALERNLLDLSEAVLQMVEVQVKAHKKFSEGLEDVEERIMELSVPSHDSDLPLERRHQVLALARRGVPLGDIVKRLKAPVGEAQLILNLQKYMGGEIPSSAHKVNEQVSPYA
jgi:hypothetical protein